MPVCGFVYMGVQVPLVSRKDFKSLRTELRSSWEMPNMGDGKQS